MTRTQFSDFHERKPIDNLAISEERQKEKDRERRREANIADVFVFLDRGNETKEKGI